MNICSVCCVVSLSILRSICSAFAWGSVANLPVSVGLMASGWPEATVGSVPTVFFVGMSVRVPCIVSIVVFCALYMCLFIEF